ncbi:MAG TPA: RNA polymerase sigma factor [Bacteroidales bacterium]|jgi:RNA polymerase sigma-70 factor (ECF subfamily)|nr:RNA polymerase sigma factor [Bacteroidales bacterium]
MNEQEKIILQKLLHPNLKEKAFEELLEMYQKKLYWYIRKIVLTHDDANDVLQNTFIRIFNNIESFKGKSSLKTWIYTIAHNEAIRYISQKKIHVSLHDISNQYMNTLKQDVFFDGEKLSETFHTVLSQLSEKQRIIFNLKYFDDLTFNEMAEILSINENTIKSTYYNTVKIIESQITL